MQATLGDAGPAQAATGRLSAAVSGIASDRVSQVLFLTLGSLVTFGYTLLLPFAFTQRVTFTNWQYLTGRLLAFAVALGLGMALVITLQVYAVRQAAAVRRAAGGSALGGVAFTVSLLPTFLCCTPVIPTLLATFGVSAVSVYTTTGSLQRFFDHHQTAFFVGSLALLVATGLWSLRRIARASCLSDDGCATDSH